MPVCSCRDESDLTGGLYRFMKPSDRRAQAETLHIHTTEFVFSWSRPFSQREDRCIVDSTRHNQRHIPLLQAMKWLMCSAADKVYIVGFFVAVHRSRNELCIKRSKNLWWCAPAVAMFGRSIASGEISHTAPVYYLSPQPAAVLSVDF